MNRKIPKWIRKTLPFIIIFLSIEFTMQLILTNLKDMIANYSMYEKILKNLLVYLGEIFDTENITTYVQDQIENVNLPLILQQIVSSLSSAIGTILIVIVYIVFLLLEESNFSKKIHTIFDTKYQSDRVHKIMDAIFISTNKYITTKTYVSLLTATSSYIILLLFGVEYAFLWSFLIFLFNYIPYIGSFVAILLPSFFAILQFGLVWSCIFIFISLVAIQIIIGNYFEPKLMGKSLNLSPLVVILSLSFWGFIWGLLGMILAVPITSIILIILAQFYTTLNFALFLTANGSLEDILIEH